MLRTLVLLLALANLGFWAWSQGWLDGAPGGGPSGGLLGVRSTGDREPERLQRQVRPDAITLSPPQAVGAAAPRSARLACLEAGPFTDAAGLRAAEAVVAAALPAGSWSVRSGERPAQWLLYLGRPASPEAAARQAQELRRLGVTAFEEVAVEGQAGPGLALSRHDSAAAAEAALAQLAARGVRGARVVPLPAQPLQWLRVDGADPALAARAAGLSPDALGGGFAACESSRTG